MTEVHRYPPSFKAAVALAAIRGEMTMEEIARRHALPPDLVRAWARRLEQEGHVVFQTEPGAESNGADFFDTGELARTIAENSTPGLAMMDSRGYCIYANRAWLEMTGYTAQELAAQPLHGLVHHHHPDGRPYPIEECPIDRALPENFAVRQHEDVFFRKDGSRFDVVCAASPVFRAGRAVATVVEIRDVSEQKRQAQHRIDSERRAVELAREAQAQQQRLNALLDAAPVGIGMADANGRVVVMNPANRLLWGQNLHEAASVAEYAEFKGWWADGGARHGLPLRPDEWALARALQQGLDVDNDIVEIEPFGQPGVRKTVSLSARPVRDPQGAVVGAVVAQVDITLQRQAEEALRAADRNKDEFIAILAHELRNPLAPIRAAVDLFDLRPPQDPVLLKANQALKRQVEHITRLVDDLLDVARISRGKVELQYKPCDLCTLVNQTAEDYRPTIEARGVRLRVDTPGTPLVTRGDRDRLAQVIGNLLHNAAKFTSAGDRIEVSLKAVRHESGETEALVVVEDTGAGMDRALVASLFRPFTQAAQDLGRSGGGLGLGLSLVKGLVELHGGRVDARSAGKGQGATFELRLPLTEPVAADGRRPEPVEAVHSLRVVVIDDNEDALAMLALLLESRGHAVVLAQDGRRGVEAARQAQPDVVICDIGLPGTLNGYDVARMLRADPAHTRTPLVSLSGYGQPSDRRASEEAGFDVHLVKPIDFESLHRVLDRLCRAQRSSPSGA